MTGRGRARLWRRRIAGTLLALGVVAWSAAWLIIAAGEAGPWGAAPRASPTAAEAPAPGIAALARAGVWPPSATATMPAIPAASTLGGPAWVAPADQFTPVQFGMSGHLMWHDVGTAVAQLDMLARDGLTVVRFDVSWRGLEPRPGHHAYLGKLDELVNAAVRRHLRPIVTIIETPGWANGGQSAWVPPYRASDYAAFAGMLARRYAGRVDAWEVWNEPDIPLFWQPSPDPGAYAALLRAASAAIRAADPGAIVVGGGVTFGNLGYLRALYADAARGTFDALAVHPYTLTRAPGDQTDRYHSLTAILDDVRALMVAEGDGGTPIWVTELGWAVVGLNSVSPAERTAYLAQSVTLIRQRPWVEVVTMYTISTTDSVRYGLSTNGQLSAAWRAYVAAVRSGGQKRRRLARPGRRTRPKSVRASVVPRGPAPAGQPD